MNILVTAWLVLGVAAMPRATAQELPGQPRGESMTGDAFTFVVLGDSRTPGGRYATVQVPAVSPVFEKQIQLINRLSPDLLVTTGDLIWGHCDPDMTTREWDAFDEAVNGLNAPLYMVVGNHDIWNGPSRETYIERYGPEYYSFDHKGAHFVVLSTEVPGHGTRISGPQLEWLERDLAGSDARAPKYVFLHQPLWGYGGTTPDMVQRRREDAAYDSWMQNVHPLLKKHGVDVVFGGHWHMYLAQEIDGIRYLTTGGGGAEMDGPNSLEWRGRFYHFLIVTVRNGQTHIGVAKMERIGPEELVTPATWSTAGKLLDDLIPRRIRLSRGTNALPRKITCQATNPFAETVTGELQFATPLGSPWTIAPRRLLVSIPPGETQIHPLGITYNGDPKEENADQWQARCIASLKVGKKVVWHQRESHLPVDRWPYEANRTILNRNLTPPMVAFSEDISRRVVIAQQNPFAQPVEQSFAWTFPVGCRWRITPPQLQLNLAANEKRETSFDIAFQGALDDALPLPILKATAVVDNEVVCNNAGAPLKLNTLEYVLSTARRAVCPKVAAGPVIDGKLTDGAWREASRNTGFLWHSGQALRTQQTAFRVCYDSDMLYLGIRFDGGPPQAKATEKDDDEIWVDDGVEIFIDTNLDRTTYYQIIVNANGVAYDALGHDKTWDSNLRAAAAREAGAWTIEVALPWAAMTGARPEAGQRLGLNLVRDWPSIEQFSHSHWSPTLGSNHVPDRFGILVLQ
jgi:predicted phosphodiesterase